LEGRREALIVEEIETINPAKGEDDFDFLDDIEKMDSFYNDIIPDREEKIKRWIEDEGPDYSRSSRLSVEPYEEEEETQYPSYQKTSGVAIASLVLGILSFFIFSLIFGTLAIFLGFRGLRSISEMPQFYTGKGLAKAGIIMGFITVPLKLLLLIVIISS
jgi:hypothetical protein